MLIKIYVSEKDSELEKLGLETEEKLIEIPLILSDEEIVGYWVDPGDNDFVLYLKHCGQYRSPYSKEVAIQLSKVLKMGYYIDSDGITLHPISVDGREEKS